MKAAHIAIVVAMLATVMVPQPGYIHPDEFFQSAEIVAGDVFNISHYRAWEFNASCPLRDITLPYLLYAPGFYCLKWLAGSGVFFPQLLLIVPRVTLAILGLIAARIVSRQCGAREDTAFWFWITSYVTWVHLTRTFSNTVETLLLLGACAMIVATINYLELTSPKAKSQYNGSSKNTNNRPFSYGKFGILCFLLGVLVCAGIFNRPTFFLFVLMPVIWWALSLFLKFRSKVLFAGFASASAFVMTFVFMTVVNTLYYEPESMSAFAAVFHSFAEGSFQAAGNHIHYLFRDCLRIPPWNFLHYNTQAANLAEHGLHPWYTHFLVHLPSLLGPMTLWLFISLPKFALSYWKQKENFNVLDRELWLLLSIFAPVVLLSLFPHQEARFLLPVVPFAFVFAALNWDFSPNEEQQTEKPSERLKAKSSVCRTPNPNKQVSRKTGDSSVSQASGRNTGQTFSLGRLFAGLWLIFNIFAFIFFGFFHQAGLVRALLHASQKLNMLEPGQNKNIHMVFFQTYMPPRHLLMLSPQSSEFITIQDLAGAHSEALVREFKDFCQTANKNDTEYSLYLFAPRPALWDTTSFILIWTKKVSAVRQNHQYFPHISMENLPRVEWSWHFWENVTMQMSLNMLHFSNIKPDKC